MQVNIFNKCGRMSVCVLKNLLCNGQRQVLSTFRHDSLLRNNHIHLLDHRIIRNLTSQATNRLADVINTWTNRLSKEGVSEPKESVNLIVAHAMGKKMIHEVNTNIVPSDETMNNIEEMCQQRLKRKPVQYIIKEWDFIDMTLEMCPPILIPRPETEELALLVIEDLKTKKADNGLFLEIGCGTGAISLCILNRLPKIKCVAVDINQIACELTERNALRYKLQDRISVIHGDAFEDSTLFRLLKDGKFDMMVSNPPYMTSEDMCELQVEVSQFEDHTALNGGDDGLDVVRNILQLSRKLLKDKSSVWLEVGLNQTSKIETIIKQNPDLQLVYDQTFQDFTKRDRYCKFSYQPK